MADIDCQADDLLAELGITDSGGSASASVTITATAPPPPPPPPTGPPPPPPPPSSGGVKLKTKDVRDAQQEIDDIFDSVISFAGKKSDKKGPPPTVAPKPKRNMHVSSYSMQVKSKKSPSPVPVKPSPPAAPAAPAAPKPTAPASQPPSAPAAKAAPPKPPKIEDQGPVALVAFGPGLEGFEVNCYGDFQVSCPPDVYEDELEVSVLGPTGSKPVDVTDNGNGQFSCSYLPTSAGEHKVSVKVRGDHIPGSPFKADVKFAAYTDKCSASGPGLVSGTTDAPCNFQIRTKDDAGYARLRVTILGPSKAEPIEMTENEVEKCVDVVYNPSAPGDYEIRILWGDAHVHGSPFKVPVTGAFINDPSKVVVSGNGLNGGNVNETLKIFVEGQVGAGPGPLGVRIVGPSKPTIVADADSSDSGVEISYTCQDPGKYQLVLRWGDDEVPSSPFHFTITGEGRAINPLMCTAGGPGVEGGRVGEPATFIVNIPDEAGPGSMSVSVSGPHPPQPIEISNNEDGTMSVTYHPVAPGSYNIDIFWADQHISGSPYTAEVTGTALRNAKNVYASGEPLEQGMKCNQLGTIDIRPRDGAGPGPLRAKLEGPSKGALELSRNEDGSIIVSFVPKDPGEYKLHLLWGDADDDSAEINGSPFSIKVE